MGVSEAFSKICSLFHSFTLMVLLKKGNKIRKMLLKRPIHSLYGQKKQQLKGSEGYKNPEKARLRPNHTLVREVRSHRNYPLCTTAQFAAARRTAARFAAARSPLTSTDSGSPAS